MRIWPTDGKLTHGFKEQRGSHIHGAVDIGAPSGTEIVAPEDLDEVIAIARIRTKDLEVKTSAWEEDGSWFPWSNYYYDVYGGLIVARAEERTHVMCHVEIECLLEMYELDVEEDDKGVVTFSNLRDPEWDFEMGTILGKVGNAGYSFGSHLHWEIHPGKGWVTYDERVDPEKWMEA